MGRNHPGCSGLAVDETKFGDDFQLLVDALFCACMTSLEAPEKRLRRDLFRMVELENRNISDAAEMLELSVSKAKDLHEKTRREIAVLLVLGLDAIGGAALQDDASEIGCRCPSVGRCRN